MPSGSHGGSRGSHSSGGSRGSSGGFSGRSFSAGSHRSYYGGHHGHYGGSHYHYPRRIRFRFGGRYYVYSSGTTSALTMLFIFLGFALLFTFGINLGRQDAMQDIRIIETDYAYYQSMIDEAKSGEGAIVDATVRGKFYNDYADKWYIVYTIPTEYGGDLEGYTYSCYTLGEVNRYRPGSTIRVAVDSVPITMETDSIDMDYENTTLEDDGEYIAKQDELVEVTTTYVIAILIDLSLAAIIVVVLLKKKQVEGQSTKKQVSTTTTTTATSTDKYCDYCGSLIEKGSKKCSSCGASSKI